MNSPTELKQIKPTSFEQVQADVFVPPEQRNQQKNSVFSIRKLAVVLLILITVVVLWFLFSAKAVKLTLSPNAEQLSLSGLHLVLSDHYLMLPGSYQIRAGHKDYYQINQSINVNNEQNQIIKLNFKPLPGQIKLVIDAPDFDQMQDRLTVQLDGKPIELTNLTLTEVAAGSHNLTITSDRYLTVKQAIEVTGKKVTDQLAVKLLPAWAEITIGSNPSNSQVFLAEKMLGTTPLTLNLLQGIKALTFKKQGFQTTSRQVNVIASQPQTLPIVNLVAKRAQLVLTTKPQGVSVSLGQTFLGKTPIEQAVAPGKQQLLTLTKAGYKTKQLHLDIASEQTISRALQLTPLLGKVSFTVKPEGALLYLNEHLLGRAKGSYTLPIKSHKIRIEKPGYVSYQQTILPSETLTQQVNVELKTLAQAKWDNMAKLIKTPTGTQLRLFRPNVQFTMGASRREQGRRANEALHQVKLTRAFYLATTEITNKEFHQFLMSHSSGNVKGHSLNGVMQPVVRVTWLQAAKFCNWLSEKQQLPAFYQIKDDKLIGFDSNSIGYRLPTEAEWAFVARYQNGTMRKFGWGKNIVPTAKSTNIADVSGAAFLGDIIAQYKDGYPVSSPVASFTANSHQLFDIDGNVAEWMHDYYHIPSALSLKVEQNPLGPTLGQYHVIRGPSWAMGDRTHLRLSYRDYSNTAREDVGFRIARYVEASQSDNGSVQEAP